MRAVLLLRLSRSSFSSDPSIDIRTHGNGLALPTTWWTGEYGGPKTFQPLVLVYSQGHMRCLCYCSTSSYWAILLNLTTDVKNYLYCDGYLMYEKLGVRVDGLRLLGQTLAFDLDLPLSDRENKPSHHTFETFHQKEFEMHMYHGQCCRFVVLWTSVRYLYRYYVQVRRDEISRTGRLNESPCNV